jgi:hypothetical protein
MKIAQYGTTIVVMHAIVHGLHGFAHKEIPVPLSLLQRQRGGTRHVCRRKREAARRDGQVSAE